MLAFKANLRYDRANMAAEQAERQIEIEMQSKRKNQIDRKS